MSQKFFATSLWRKLGLEKIFSLYQRLVLWSFSVASARYATPWILFFSYIEGIFFPVPPDAFLLARGVARRKGLLRLALAVAVFSVLGGATSYAIGAWLFEDFGAEMIALLGLEHAYAHVLQAFSGSIAFWTVVLFGFTILPFKAIALASGAAAVPFHVFLAAALLSRTARMLGIALLVLWFGARLKEWLQSRQAFLLSILLAMMGLLLLVLYLYFS